MSKLTEIIGVILGGLTYLVAGGAALLFGSWLVGYGYTRGRLEAEYKWEHLEEEQPK